MSPLTENRSDGKRCHRGAGEDRRKPVHLTGKHLDHVDPHPEETATVPQPAPTGTALAFVCPGTDLACFPTVLPAVEATVLSNKAGTSHDIGNVTGHLMTTLTVTKRPLPTRAQILGESDRQLEAGLLAVAAQVRCEFVEGMLILSGKVRSYRHKQIAQECTREIAGVEGNNVFFI